MEFSILGPLDVRLGGESVQLGGAKQRAVLAALLLREGAVVSVERLVDEVWGNDPPPSAEQTLTSYVSRLRQLFNGHGPVLERCGAGYLVDLRGATLDASRFAELRDSASVAAAVGEHTHVLELASAALALWRGPALADVALASAGRAEADRLEELRLHTYELRFDAELALGRHEHAIGELQALVAQNPYRERFVAQLMLALYRSGRHADALEVYEQTRRRLDDDLGLQPSTDLQQLSGQIVRQDAQLRRPAPVEARLSPTPSVGRRSRRIAELVLTGSIVAAIMALTASGGAAPPFDADSTSGPYVDVPASELMPRALLVLSKTAVDRSQAGRVARSVESAEIVWDVDVDVRRVDEASLGAQNELVRRIERGGLALVVVVGDGAASRSIASVVADVPNTSFVFIDASRVDLGLDGADNAYAIRFAEEQSSQLVGYLSALVRTRDSAERVDTVSVVSGPPTPQRARALAGFRQGVKAARPEVSILVGYVEDTSDPIECEQLATEQIDRGSDVVFVDAGLCGRGAIAVARLVGAWGAGGEDVVGPSPGAHVLASTYKEYERAVYSAFENFMLGAPRSEADVVLGLDDDYAVGVEHTSPTIPDALWERVVRKCGEIRKRAEVNST